MQTIHLEISGKSARVQVQLLPDAHPSPPVDVRTSAGPLQTIPLVSGVAGVSATFESLATSDPELDLAMAGKRIERETLTTAYYDPEAPAPRAIGDFQEIDIVCDAVGVEKERRPHVVRRPNINDVHPVKVGKRLPLAKALTQFVFRQTLQVVHVDSLTYDFLFTFADALSRTKEIALVGAGAKGNLPLILREKGTPYRGFVFGQTEGDRYRLLLLLSDMELKLPPEKSASEA